MKHFSAGTVDGKGKGTRAFKMVEVRVFNIENKGSYLTRHRARPGHIIAEDVVDKLLDQIADQIEKRFPGHDYQMVEVGEARFNFVWRGRREAPEIQEPAGK